MVMVNTLSLCITLFAWLDHSNNSMLLSSANVSKMPEQEFGGNSKETFNIQCICKTDSSDVGCGLVNITLRSS